MDMRQLLISLLLGANLLAGCSSGPLSVHKLDIRQGNALEPETLARVQPGITRQQVQFLLGNPLIEDPFHADRWDYVYYRKPGKGEREIRRVTIFFEGDRVLRLEGLTPGSTGG